MFVKNRGALREAMEAKHGAFDFDFYFGEERREGREGFVLGVWLRVGRGLRDEMEANVGSFWQQLREKEARGTKHGALLLGEGGLEGRHGVPSMAQWDLGGDGSGRQAMEGEESCAGPQLLSLRHACKPWWRPQASSRTRPCGCGLSSPQGSGTASCPSRRTPTEGCWPRRKVRQRRGGGVRIPLAARGAAKPGKGGYARHRSAAALPSALPLPNPESMPHRGVAIASFCALLMRAARDHTRSSGQEMSSPCSPTFVYHLCGYDLGIWFFQGD